MKTAELHEAVNSGLPGSQRDFLSLCVASPDLNPFPVIFLSNPEPLRCFHIKSHLSILRKFRNAILKLAEALNPNNLLWASYANLLNTVKLVNSCCCPEGRLLGNGERCRDISVFIFVCPSFLNCTGSPFMARETRWGAPRSTKETRDSRTVPSSLR